MWSGFLPLTSEEFPNADLTFENHPQAFNLLNLADANRETDHSCAWSCQSILQLRISLWKWSNVCVGGNGYNSQKMQIPKGWLFPANRDRKLTFQSQVSWISCVVGRRKNTEASVKGLISIKRQQFFYYFFFYFFVVIHVLEGRFRQQRG